MDSTCAVDAVEALGRAGHVLPAARGRVSHILAHGVWSVRRSPSSLEPTASPDTVASCVLGAQAHQLARPCFVSKYACMPCRHSEKVVKRHARLHVYGWSGPSRLSGCPTETCWNKTICTRSLKALRRASPAHACDAGSCHARVFAHPKLFVLNA
jgi:hypothetical protein